MGAPLPLPVVATTLSVTVWEDNALVACVTGKIFRAFQKNEMLAPVEDSADASPSPLVGVSRHTVGP